MDWFLTENQREIRNLTRKIVEEKVIPLRAELDESERFPWDLMRIFADAANRFNHSALDTGAELLVVSQFTLYGDTRKGRRPDFTRAAPPQEAERLYEHTVELLRQTGLRVATGRFQEYMQVSLQNDGPVTLLLDSADRQRSRRD